MEGMYILLPRVSIEEMIQRVSQKASAVLELLNHVQLFVTLWTVAHQTPLSMRFPRQEYWSGLPFPSPGHLPDQGIELASLAWQADSLPLRHYPKQLSSFA